MGTVDPGCDEDRNHHIDREPDEHQHGIPDRYGDEHATTANGHTNAHPWSVADADGTEDPYAPQILIQQVSHPIWRYAYAAVIWNFEPNTNYTAKVLWQQVSGSERVTNETTIETDDSGVGFTYIRGQSGQGNWYLTVMIGEVRVADPGGRFGAMAGLTGDPIRHFGGCSDEVRRST